MQSYAQRSGLDITLQVCSSLRFTICTVTLLARNVFDTSCKGLPYVPAVAQRACSRPSAGRQDARPPAMPLHQSSDASGCIGMLKLVATVRLTRCRRSSSKRQSMMFYTALSYAEGMVLRNKTRGCKSVGFGSAFLYCADALDLYEQWPKPTCIISDGPYGLGKYPGEPKTVTGLAQWYAPHIAAWSRYADTNTTLWFWSSELAWATVHHVLEEHGWQYEEACVWDKGLGHVAGNCNSKTIRGVPVVTEVAVRYTKRNLLPSFEGEMLSIKEWVRAEWQRSGLPMRLANDACGVKNAATRKYLTRCHLWYHPPTEAMQRLADFCCAHGKRTPRPYFSLDGSSQFDPISWSRMRSKWRHTHGMTNVWNEPAVHGEERVRVGSEYVHANQKPLRLMGLQVASCTDEGDAVWEPFGGLCSASVAAAKLGRRSFAAELLPRYFEAASWRLETELVQAMRRAA